MKYRQLNGEERSVLAALRLVGLKQAEIARELCGFIWELLRTQDCYQAQSTPV